MQSLAAHFARGDQSGLLQHAQVLHHAEARHRQLRLQLGERAAVALKEEVKQPPTAWIGEGAKNGFIFHGYIICDLLVTCQDVIRGFIERAGTRKPKVPFKLC